MKFLAVRSFAALMLCLGLIGVGQTSASELVVNGGFETGDTTGWTISNANGQPAQASGVLSFADQNLNPYQGSFFGLLGTQAPDGGGPVVFSQTIATTPGDQYTFSFAYFIQSGSPNEFLASFNGTQVFSDVNDNSFPTDASPNVTWVPESFVVTATSSSTLIQLSSGNDANYNGMDSVSVMASPEPSSLLLCGLGAAGLLLVARRRRKA